MAMNVGPAAGETASQLPVLVAVALNCRLVPPETVTVCAAGAVSPSR